MLKFEIYIDKASDWRWRLWHRNGNIIADSGQGYSNKSDALNGIDLVKSTSAGTPVEE